jgi:GNAT superfamily N-acetyltransferase
MEDIVYGPIRFDDSDEIHRVAEIHESAPLNWNPTHEVREERVQYWCTFLGDAAQNPAVFVITARTQLNEIIGIHWLHLVEKYGEKCAYIQSLWVSDKHRNVGIGRELKKRGEEWAKSSGAKFIATNVFYANEKMIAYNLKLGFSARQVEMIKDLE